MPVYMQQHFGGPRLVLASRTPPQSNFGNANNANAKNEGKVQRAASKPLLAQGVTSHSKRRPMGNVRKENLKSAATSVASGNSPRKVHRAAGFGLVPSNPHNK